MGKRNRDAVRQFERDHPEQLDRYGVDPRGQGLRRAFEIHYGMSPEELAVAVRRAAEAQKGRAPPPPTDDRSGAD